MNSESAPQPSHPIDIPVPIQDNRGWEALKQGASLVVVSAGWLVFVAAMVLPSRTAGATRSSRLLWQQHQREIQTTIDAEGAVEAENLSHPLDAGQK
ncbi:MAG: hypothetical protein HYR88_04800 [Verrucomicrobia bacterium]|nr:hypothetical protein [Verrucomicrobiota bacterium]MBI3871031.1 hypothetical protein [Verrucomicrobiota bacterium]